MAPWLQHSAPSNVGTVLAAADTIERLTSPPSEEVVEEVAEAIYQKWIARSPETGAASIVRAVILAFQKATGKKD